MSSHPSSSSRIPNGDPALIDHRAASSAKSSIPGRTILSPVARTVALFAALALSAGFVSGCEAGLPSAEEIADRMAETYRDPGSLHVVSTTSATFETDSPMGALRVSVAMDAQQWQDGPTRVRSESTMALNLEAPDGGEAEMMVGMMDMMGLDRMEMLVVRDGDEIWSWFDMMDTWSHQNVGELESPGFDVDQMADIMGTTVRTLVDNYDLTYVGQETIAGREAFVVSAAPRADAEPALLFDVVRLEAAELAVDMEHYYVLRSDVTVRPDWEAAIKAQTGANPALDDALSAFPETSEMPDMPDMLFTIHSEVTDITFDANIDPERFVFTPPPGSTEMDLDNLGGLGGLSPMGGFGATENDLGDLDGLGDLGDLSELGLEDLEGLGLEGLEIDGLDLDALGMDEEELEKLMQEAMDAALEEMAGEGGSGQETAPTTP